VTVGDVVVQRVDGPPVLPVNRLQGAVEVVPRAIGVNLAKAKPRHR
jgi:hypothetical protein